MRSFSTRDSARPLCIAFATKVIYGRLDGVDDFIFYQADSPADVEQAFKDIVDDYIDECREEGVEPQGMALVLA